MSLLKFCCLFVKTKKTTNLIKDVVLGEVVSSLLHVKVP